MKPEPYSSQSLDNTVMRFTAPWCRPCRIYGPVFDQVLTERPETAVVIDVDEHPDVAERFAVQGLPTTVITKDGEVVIRMVGLRPSATLIEMLNKTHAADD